MSQRFYSPTPIDSTEVTIQGTEAHHLLHVMRAAKGDHVVLFDGSGAEYPAVITSLLRKKVKLEIRRKIAADRESAVRLSLGVALPKGDRQKFLVEKCVELGVSQLVPIVTERGVAHPSESAIGKLRRTVIEACKQCGRNRLMEVSSPQHCQEYFRSTDGQAERRIATLHGPRTAVVKDLSGRDALTVCAAVGPAGGFTIPELKAAASCGWEPISLGPRVLRVETATLVIATIYGLS